MDEREALPLRRPRGRPKGSKGKKEASFETENENGKTSTTANTKTQSPKKRNKGTYRRQWTNHTQHGRQDYARTLEELVGSDNMPAVVPPGAGRQPGSTGLSAAGGPGSRYPKASEHIIDQDFQPLPYTISRLVFPQGTIPVYEREDWKAIEPTGDMSPMKPFVSSVRFVDTGKGSERCRGQESCFSIVQRIQQQHMSQGLNDINYNFLVADDGSVYIGRGYEADCVRSEELQHLKGDCYDIAFIGDYRTDEVPGPTLAAGYNMIAYGHDKKNIKSHPKIIKTMDIKDNGVLDMALKKYFDDCYTLK